MHDAYLAGKEKNTALYKPRELQNLDLKTDGSPISYKPEYHPSAIGNRIFPSLPMPGLSPSISEVRLDQRKLRTALDNRRQARSEKDVIILD